MGDAVAFGHPIAAGLIPILSVFGFVHLRRTAPEKEILPAFARVLVSAS